MDMMELLKQYIDTMIFAVLGFMSIIMLWKVIERIIFYNSIKITDYKNIHDLDIDLTHNLTPIYTIGANAPYVGLLGTVVGILITFYDMGKSGGNIDAGQIMMGLALALKATALGILVAIPAMMFYNYLARKVELKKSQWQSAFGYKTH